MDDIFDIEFCLAKQLATIYSISSSYGDIYLDDDMAISVEIELRQMLQKRLIELEKEKAISHNMGKHAGNGANK